MANITLFMSLLHVVVVLRIWGHSLFVVTIDD